MSNLIFETPATLEELVGCLEAANENTLILGGGTDLVIQMKKKNLSVGTIIDMTGIKDLDKITVEEHIKIGANVTYSQLQAHPILRTRAACLTQMALKVGSKQIQNMGRLPGNLANASKAGDSIPALIALDASVKTINGKGEIKLIKVQDMILGNGKTVLKGDEAIIEVLFPMPSENTRSGFGKIGHGARNELTIANANLAMVVEYDPGRSIIDKACLVVGAVAPVAFRAFEAEAFIQSKKPTRMLMSQLAELLQRKVQTELRGNLLSKHKIDDMHGLAIDVFESIFGDVVEG